MGVSDDPAARHHPLAAHAGRQPCDHCGQRAGVSLRAIARPSVRCLPLHLRSRAARLRLDEAGDQHVPARGLAPSAREHALPLHLRGQRRGPSRPRPLPRVLSPLRDGGRGGPGLDEPALGPADGRREWGDSGRLGGLLPLLSDLSRGHPGADLFLPAGGRASGGVLSLDLVHLAGPLGGGDPRRPLGHGRGGLLGTRRGVRDRHDPLRERTTAPTGWT